MCGPKLDRKETRVGEGRGVVVGRGGGGYRHRHSKKKIGFVVDFQLFLI